MNPLKIILVDDNIAFRNALKSILIREFKVHIIGEASCAEEFWNIKDRYHADIILMDIMMPGTDGITLTKKIIWERNKMKVLAITMHYDEVYLISLIEAGFVGCIFKNNLYNEIGKALEAIMCGKRFFPENILFNKT